MKAAACVAEILKREGVDLLFAYPLNPLIDAVADVGIRPIIVRQERVGLHMADAMSRLTSGRRTGVFVMQLGPGAENAFGGVAQAYAESVPILVLPAGYPRAQMNLPPNFNALHSYRPVTKWADQVPLAETVPDVMLRAFTQLRNGRPGPVLVEFPADVLTEDVPEPLHYGPAASTRYGPDPEAVSAAADVLVAARRPLIYAGQGVHYARAWPQLRELAELLEAPVATSLEGKSAFPEQHPLSLGAGGRALPLPVHEFVHSADCVFGIGASFTKTSFGIAWPDVSRTVVHATLDPSDFNRGIRADHVIAGDAALTLDALNHELRARIGTGGRGRADALAAEIQALRARWWKRWEPKMRSNEVPLSPYRVLSDLFETVDVANTIITHDAGGPRDQLSPFWQTREPLTYLGWGKTTQLGYGLGLAMGAKLTCPDKLCVNVMGDAAFGFTAMDIETAARNEIPTLTILLNNSTMACELWAMELSTAKFRTTDITGDYTGLARSLGAYGERVEQPGEIVPAIRRAVEQTHSGKPAVLEFITAEETEFSGPATLEDL
ncbi:MAG: thiamine pyrophosphate-requiring protein [Streptosporangiales bacterium]|nr:thiamine pyrophosphate-requiring protein [Streptosporangiales bacterium]